jgi:hypothetical protein
MASPLPPDDQYAGLSAPDFAAMGMTPEQFADLQQSLAGLDFSGIGMGGLNILGGADPVGTQPYRTFTAPLSNKGNPTSKLTDNQLVVYENQPVRLVDNRTGQVVFEGTGYDAAQKAIEMGQGLSNTLGRKAAWDIQTADPMTNTYVNVANEKANKSTLGKIASVVGTALPVAVGFIPGLQGVGAVLASAGAGAAGSALAGRDILSGALMGGLSAAGGQFVGDALRGATGLSTNAARAIGTGVGSTAGGLATGQSLKNSLLGGVASGGLSYLGGEVFGNRGTSPTGEGGTVSNIGDSGVQLGDIVATARIPNFSGAAFNTNFFDRAQMNSDRPDPYGTGDFAVNPAGTGLTQDEIVATALRGPTTGSMSVNVAPGGSSSGLTQDEIVATGKRETPQTSSTLAVTPGGAPSGLTQDEIVATGKREVDRTSSTVNTSGATPPFSDEITVTAKKPVDTSTNSSVLTIPGGDFSVPKDILDLADKTATDDKKGKFGVDDALLALGLLGGLGGGGGGSGVSPTGQKLQSIFSAKLPTPGEGGSIKLGGLGPRVEGPAGTFSARPMTDWYRYGMGPAMDIPAGTDLSRATSPYAGYGPGTLGQETFNRITGNTPAPRPQLLPNMVSSLGRDATSAQITSALAGAKTAEEARRLNPGTVYFDIDAATANAMGDPNAVGSVMSIQDLQRRMAAKPVGKYEGGSMGYSRGSSRESFAVEGPGTGRSDDIPAVLSDGEYVMDAETVALLGDGSSKAGAKKLDQMRVNLRKHKGRNLAKGKFSVNAKAPERYLSGGRA